MVRKLQLGQVDVGLQARRDSRQEHPRNSSQKMIIT